MRIGVIGCGTIASAVVRGIADNDHQIMISKRSARHSQALADEFQNVRVAANQGVVDASDVVFLGLMAEVAQEVLGNLEFREEHKIITFMAGATLNQVDAMVRPARAVAIMMPFPAISKGGSPIMMQGDARLIDEIFGARNSIFPLRNSDEMAAYLCAQAVLSVVARMVGDASEWLGERVSDKPQAEAFLRALVASNLSVTESNTLIEALNAPGGYNQRLRLHMEASGIGDSLMRGLDELE